MRYKLFFIQSFWWDSGQDIPQLIQSYFESWKNILARISFMGNFSLAVAGEKLIQKSKFLHKSIFLKSAMLCILLWRILIEILKRKTYIENRYDTQSHSFDYKNYGPKSYFLTWNWSACKPKYLAQKFNEIIMNESNFKNQIFRGFSKQGLSFRKTAHI